MEVRRATLRAFDAAAYRATVQVAGSRSSYLGGVPVSRGIPSGELVAGRECVVVFFQESDPTDCMLIGVH